MKREKISGIYRILCTKNGRYYHGSSVDIQSRWSRHKSSLKRNKHCNAILQNNWNKYGEGNFVFELVEIVPAHNLRAIEDVYLKKYVGTSNCMNVLKNSNNVPNNKGFLGRKHSEDTKRKLSEVRKGTKLSEETKKKIGQSNLGHNARSGKQHPLYGKKRLEFSKKHHMKTAECRLKSSLSHGATPVIVVSPTGEEFVIINRSEFSRQHGINRSALNKVISGKCDNYRGWVLKPQTGDLYELGRTI